MFSNVLLPNGDVQLCAMDYGLRHTLGNLFRESYSSIVNGPVLAKVFDELDRSASDILCRECEYAVPGTYR